MSEIAKRDGAKRDNGYSGGINELVEIARQTDAIKELGSTLIESGLLPDTIKKPEAAVAVMIKGAELGMSAMYALSHIAIIKGKPTMSAEAMLALVQRGGHVVRIAETTSERCVVEGFRREDPKHPTRIEWTMDDAKTAGLLGNAGPWKTYPRAMLRSRAVSELCRAAFPDVLSGVSFVPEEMGAVVNENGEVVESPSTDGADGKRIGVGRKTSAGKRAADTTDTTDTDSADIQDAEVVEDGEGSDQHYELMNQIAEKMDEFPEGAAPDSNTVYSFANDGVEPARRTLAKLNRDLEKSLEGVQQ